MRSDPKTCWLVWLQGERPTQLPSDFRFQFASLLDGEWVGRSCGRQKESGNKKQVGGGFSVCREEVRKTM